MWSTNVASPQSFGSKFTDLQNVAGNNAGVTDELAARHVSIAAPTEACAVALQVGEPRLMKLFGKTAAISAVSQHDTALVRTLEIRAPGAHPSNTEVRWDDTQKQLWVGVWCGKRPESLTLPLRFPIPELAWLRTFHLPRHAGQYAQAWIKSSSSITVQVPTDEAQNVIPLHRRVASEPKYATSGPHVVDGHTALMTALRRLGIAICTALCVPVFVLLLFLFGVVLLPLLPLIGVSLVASTGESPTAPPAHPKLPAAPAAALPFEHAQAA
jgi:hypothetical protein